MENIIIDLLIIITTSDGTYMEQFINGSYDSLETCRKDAQVLNASIENHYNQISFDVKFDCSVFKYETD